MRRAHPLPARRQTSDLPPAMRDSRHPVRRCLPAATARGARATISTRSSPSCAPPRLAVGGETTAVAGEISCDWADRRFDMSRDTWVVDGPDGDLAAYALCLGHRPRQPHRPRLRGPPRPRPAGHRRAPARPAARPRPRRLAAARGPSGQATGPGHAGASATTSASTPSTSALGFTRTRVFLRMDDRRRRAAAGAGPGRLGSRCDPFRGRRRRRRRARRDQRSLQRSLPRLRPAARRLAGAGARRRSTSIPSLFLVARDGDEVAGAVLCFATPEVGIVDQLAVRKPWRGCGLGRALLLHALHLLSARGYESPAARRRFTERDRCDAALREPRHARDSA